jgi:hypothetical protein
LEDPIRNLMAERLLKNMRSRETDEEEEAFDDSGKND